VGWDFDDVREHYVERLLGVRPDELRAFDPARHLTLGRAVGAEVMARTMALWRTEASSCAGALVWFLRDLWPGAGCGLVDDLGEPKSVMHALKRVQQPQLAVVEDRGLNGLVLHLVNEAEHAIDGMVEVVLYQHGEVELARQTKPVMVPARGAEQWPLTDWLDAFMDLNWTYRFGPAPVDVVVVHWTAVSGETVGRAVHFEPPQLIAFNGEPGLKAVAVRAADGSVVVDVSTRATAYGVHFDTLGWTPSDEFFHLPPGGSHRVRFTPQVNTIAEPVWFASARSLNGRLATPVVMTKAAT
jgi:beta-mannosidase